MSQNEGVARLGYGPSLEVATSAQLDHTSSVAQTVRPSPSYLAERGGPSVGTHQPRETRESRTTAEQNTVGRCWLLGLVGLLSVESGLEACVLHPGVQAQV